MIRNFVM